MPLLENFRPPHLHLAHPIAATLADAIARKSAIPAVHLDQLYHPPHSILAAPAPEVDLRFDQAAIAQEQWVMEGKLHAPPGPQCRVSALQVSSC